MTAGYIKERKEKYSMNLREEAISGDVFSISLSLNNQNILKET